MLRRDRLIRMQIQELLDACLFAVSFYLAYALRSDPTLMDLLGLTPVDAFDSSFWVLYLVLIPAAPMILETQGFYTRPALSSRMHSAWLLAKGCLLTTLVLVLGFFLFQLTVPRWTVIWFTLISFSLVSLKEELLLLLSHTKLARAQFRRRFILMGNSAETARMRADLEAKSAEEIGILAELNLDETPVHQLVELLHEHSVNGVIICAKRAFFDQVEAAIRACELEGIEVWLVTDFFQTQISRTTLDEFHGRPILVFSSAPETSWAGVAKQLLDFAGALLLLLLSSPILLAVALIVRFSSPGPILFRQQRSGLNGRPFMLYKFRTMVTNAEQFKHELAAMNEMKGPVFKVTNDPRITPIGKFLRKYSLDEFPQLVNVLRGEMSLVGPRPLPVDEVKRFYDLAHRRRLSVRPGLTCLWQISGRNDVKDFRDWVRLDLEYIDNWSLWLDLKILFLTVPVVLRGTGAK
jgi:exopolysaccharide biosynthesis polyprenyl glycosylphosphotransferase